MSNDPYVLLVEDNPGEARLVQMMSEEAPSATLPAIYWEQLVRAASARLIARADAAMYTAKRAGRSAALTV